MLDILDYNLKLIHVLGKELVGPDTLFRRPDLIPKDNGDNDQVTLLPESLLAHLPMPLSWKDNGWPHMLSKNFHKHPLKSLVIFFSSRLHGLSLSKKQIGKKIQRTKIVCITLLNL